MVAQAPRWDAYRLAHHVSEMIRMAAKSSIGFLCLLLDVGWECRHELLEPTGRVRIHHRSAAHSDSRRDASRSCSSGGIFLAFVKASCNSVVIAHSRFRGSTEESYLR